MQKNIFIEKASGERELFSEQKLRYSLDKVNAPKPVIDEIILSIKGKLKDGMKVSEIYRSAFSILHRKQHAQAIRYSMKKAIFELGPSGYLFEQLVARIFLTRGFQVETDVIIKGYCVTHEVDVSAKKDNHLIMIECKFHNHQGIKSDVKTALYVQARFEDIQKMWLKEPSNTYKYHQAWLVTNTKLTLDAIQYAKCVGIKVVGWNYPPGNSLHYLIDKTKIFPITCLTSLSKTHKKELLHHNIVTSKDIIENKDILLSLNMKKLQAKRVINEINNLHG